jgi:hypothetical protein
MSPPPEAPRFQVTKLDAARRQLRVAISLWFQGGDEIAVHTLAAAAHQVIHDINTKKGGKGLLFDSPIWKPEYRKEVVTRLKRDLNFFKHADNDPEGVTEFCPLLSEMFMMCSLFGIENFGLRFDPHERAFYEWYCLNYPQFLSDKGLRQRAELSQLQAFRELGSLSPHQFFNLFMQASTQLSNIR